MGHARRTFAAAGFAIISKLTMKAVTIVSHGGVEGLELRNVETPPFPTADRVRVRVRAAGLNRADLLQLRGHYPAPPGVSQDIPGLEFAGDGGFSPDASVAALYFAAGLGLFFGMMIARRVGVYFEMLGRTVAFIGWSLLLQGLLFAFIGLMPALLLACVLLFVSRVLLGAEFAVQETLLMRLVPDRLRGRVSTTDRATELLVWSLSTGAAGWSLKLISARTLTVVAGLLSASSGLVWLVLFARGMVKLPVKTEPELEKTESGTLTVVSES